MKCRPKGRLHYLQDPHLLNSVQNTFELGRGSRSRRGQGPKERKGRDGEGGCDGAKRSRVDFIRFFLSALFSGGVALRG